jgi:hypothetical protein
MTEKSGWYHAFGPGYLDAGLRRRGIEDMVGLISVSTVEGDKFYPQGQFAIEPDQSLDAGERLLPNTNLLKFYGEVIKPAIEDKIIDEYTITAWLFTVHPPLVSKAEAIANNPANVDGIKLQAEDWFYRMTRP